MRTPLHNPVFEALSEQAKKFKTIPEFVIYEEESSGAEMKADEVQEYFIMILDVMQKNIISFVNSTPDQDTKDKILPSFMEKMDKLGNNASITDLMTGLNDIWKDVMNKINASKIKDQLSPIFDKANAGVNKTLESYQSLKKIAGSKLESTELLSFVNKQMSELIPKMKTTLGTAKTTIDNATK